MRLSRLELLRYGKFSDRTLTFPQGDDGLDFHLIFGPNEAGKSTTRSALSELFFGIERSTSYAFFHDYGELRIGATLEEGGKELVILRKKGSKNTLLDEDGKPIEERLLTAMLGSADKTFFERMFSLDHVSLVTGGKQLLDAKDDVGRMLFQASFGLSRLGELRRELDDEADQLWAPRKSKDRAFYVALEQYVAHGQTLERCTVRVKDYQAAEERVKCAREAAEAVALELEGLTRDGVRLERIRRVAPGLARRASWLEELAALDAVKLLPENVESVLQEAQIGIARSTEELARLDVRRKQTEKTLAACVPNEVLLGLAGDLEALGARRHELRRYPEDLSKRRAEVQLLSTQIQNLARELGWDTDVPDTVKARLPSALALEALDQLLLQQERLTATLEATDSALVKRREELAELLAQRDPAKDSGAPAKLRDAVEDARKLGDVDARRKELQVPAELGRERFMSALAQLAPWKGKLAALRAVPAPSEGELDSLTQRFDGLDKQIELATLTLSSDRSTAKSLALKEEQVRRDAAPVTREQLLASRRLRDERFNGLREQLERDDVDTKAGPRFAPEGWDALEGAIRQSDELSDRRFDAAAASATLQQLKAELEQLNVRIVDGEERLQRLENDKARLRDELNELTSGLNLSFEHPSRFRRWLSHRREALELGAIAERDHVLLQQYEKDVASIEAQLRNGLQSCESPPSSERAESFSALLRRGMKLVTVLDEERSQQKTLVEQVNKLERSLADLSKQRANAEQAIERWRADYRASLDGFGLKDIEPSAAKLALNLLRDLSTKMARLESIQRERIDTMTRDLVQFESSVRATVEAAGETATDLLDRNAFEQVHELLARLKEQERLFAQRAQAARELDELERARAEAEARRGRAQATLRPLFERAAVSDLPELHAKVESSNRKRELIRSIQDVERNLLETGDGLSIANLEEETRSIDLGSLDAKLTETRTALARLSEQRKSLDLSHVDASRALADIAGHADAALAASRRNEALTSMSEAIERYLRVRTSSALLKWAMERFRRERQGPLLGRASRLFANLTLGRFEGLLIEYDDQDRPELVGLRPGGSFVPLDGMSSGTTNQLYLALRVAALELHLENATALPFVADDLFIHFDDARSTAAFRVLAELARRTQVLFFTHHEHLVELADAALEHRANVIRL
ncbi:MAG: AAA family ATPase [Polyangiaceae bacterium]